MITPHAVISVRIQTIPSKCSVRSQDSERGPVHCLPHASEARRPDKTAFKDLSNTREIIVKTLIASSRLPRLVTAAIFGSLAFGCTALCIAGDSGDVPHAVVRFGDLDLSSRDGAAALYRRIYATAYDVCRSFDIDMNDRPDLTVRDTCVHGAVRNAVAKINQPALSAIYNARNRDPLPITVATAQNR